LTLDITRAIDADGAATETYKPYIMLRDESWAWMENFTYKVGSIVSHKGEMFVSLTDSNLGNDPVPYEDTEFWSTIMGPQGIQGEKGDKGDTGPDGISCTHSWNGTVLTVNSASGTSSVDLKGEKGDKGDTGEQGPAGEVVSAGDMVVRYVGDGQSLVYMVQHNLGTTKVIHATQRQDGTFVYPTVRAIDENYLEVTFTKAPAPNEMTMSIYSGGIVEVPTYYIHIQDVASTRWEIFHNTGRYVDITVLDVAGNTIEALVSQPSTDVAYVEFNEPMTGKAVVR
jgi:hypothetical protein